MLPPRWSRVGPCFSRTFLPPSCPPGPAAPGTDPGLHTVAGSVRVPPAHPLGVFLSGRRLPAPPAPGYPATAGRGGPRPGAAVPGAEHRGAPQDPSQKPSGLFSGSVSIFKSRRSRPFGCYLARQYTVPAAFSTRARKSRFPP